jgi:hypothetical protein
VRSPYSGSPSHECCRATAAPDRCRERLLASLPLGRWFPGRRPIAVCAKLSVLARQFAVSAASHRVSRAAKRRERRSVHPVAVKHPAPVRTVAERRDGVVQFALQRAGERHQVMQLSLGPSARCSAARVAPWTTAAAARDHRQSRRPTTAAVIARCRSDPALSDARKMTGWRGAELTSRPSRKHCKSALKASMLA